MLTFDETNCIGQFLDTTWGRSSTTGPSTISIKGSLADSKLILTFTTYATVASERVLSQQMPTLTDQGKQALDKYLKALKSSFKDACGRTLKTKTISTTPSVEIISLQQHVSPKRTVAFRMVTVLTVE
jgi:hypothetical protein